MPILSTFSRRMAVAIALFACFLSLAVAGTSAVDFGGERFVRQYDGPHKSGMLTEFVRANETVDNWTKLIGFHSYPRSGNDALRAAASLGQVLRQRNVKFGLITN